MVESALETNHQPHGVHVVPVKVLLGTWAALVALTIITVTVADRDLGRFNIIVALAVATLKASLVGLFFMHLKYDNPLYAFILIFALSFVALFIMGTLIDTQAYQSAMQPPSGVVVPQP